MNRRTFLRATAGCAVAVPVAVVCQRTIIGRTFNMVLIDDVLDVPTMSAEEFQFLSNKVRGRYDSAIAKAMGVAV